MFYRLIAFLVTTFNKQLFRTFKLKAFFVTEGKVNMTLILPILHSYYNSSVDPLKLSSSSIYLHCFTVIKLSLKLYIIMYYIETKTQILYQNKRENVTFLLNISTSENRVRLKYSETRL